MLDASTLLALLADPECPYARSANDIPTALRENRPPARTRWINQRALIDFIAERTGEEPSRAHVDDLMLGQLGAHHARLVDLDGVMRRAMRRIVGQPEPTPVTYEVPGVP